MSSLKDLYTLGLLTLYNLSGRFLSPAQEDLLARSIGGITYSLRPKSRQVIANRLSALLGDELSPIEINRLTREVFQHRWVEGFSFSAASRKNLSRWVTCQGLEHLQEALETGKGVVLWESPFGKRLLAGAVLAEKGFALCQVHAEEHGTSSDTWLGRKVVQRMRRKAEARLFPEIIDIQDDSLAYLRPVISRLKQNGIVVISGLGEKGHKFVPVEFMGARRLFATGAVSLAKMTGASIIPIFCFKDEPGVDWVVLEKPINLNSSEDKNEAMSRAVRQYAGLLEYHIRRNPAQWYQWRYSSIDSFFMNQTGSLSQSSQTA